MSVQIGHQAIVELPPRVFRGHVHGAMFDLDKSFVLPDAVSCMREVKAFYAEHPGFSVLIVGHTDRTGSEEHNRKLSEERARAVAAFLTEDVDTWVGFYERGNAGRPWGRLEDQHMLATIGELDGIANGQRSRRWSSAISAFGGSGEDLDDATRNKLIAMYMQQQNTRLPAGVRITTHGCGESHPFDPAAGATANRKNRRVEVYLFEDQIEPAPPAICPVGGCGQYAQWNRRSAAFEHLGEAPDVAALLAMEWPAEVTARLPGDTTIALHPAGLPMIEAQLGDAMNENGIARLEFPLVCVPTATRLEARTGGKTVVLWEDRAFGDIAIATASTCALDDLLIAELVESSEPQQLTASSDALPELPEL